MSRASRYRVIAANAVFIFSALLFSVIPSQATNTDQIIIVPLPTATRTPTPINVGNFVWDDWDNDGRQDAGEPGLAGVTVQLWNSTKTSLINQTVSNENGNYTLIAPTPGNYRIRAILPNPVADFFSPKDMAGGDDQKDSDINPSGTNFGFTDTYVFGSNLISITTIDIGINRYVEPTPTRTPTPVNIGNFVWIDTNENGIQDDGEPGKGGVLLQLWNSNKTGLINSTFSKDNGSYTLIAPGPGDYRIRVLLNADGDVFSPEGQGGNEQEDSDINSSGVDEGFTDVFTLASNVISTTRYDIGIIPSGQPTYTPVATSTPTHTPTASSTPTATPSLTPSSTATESPPSVLEWIAPTGTLTSDYGAPIYQWGDVPSALSYQLWVARDDASQVIYENVADATYCNGVDCQFNAVNVSNNYWLTNGTYQAWITEETNAGFMPWAGPFWFTLDVPQPDPITVSTVINEDTGTPTLSWTAVPNASWYEIWVGTAGPEWATQYTAWHTYLELGCNVANTCTLTPDLNLSADSYVWYIRSWGPGGFNTGGVGSGWVEAVPFDNSDVPAPDPVTVFNVVNADSGNPTFTWGATANSTWYEIWIGSDDPDWTQQYNGWHRYTSLGCHIAAECSITPDLSLPSGSYTWYVRSWGPGGFNTGGVGLSWVEAIPFIVP